MTSLDVESLYTNIPLNETIINCTIDSHNKNLYHETVIRKPSFTFDYLYSL